MVGGGIDIKHFACRPEICAYKEGMQKVTFRSEASYHLC